MSGWARILVYAGSEEDLIFHRGHRRSSSLSHKNHTAQHLRHPYKYWIFNTQGMNNASFLGFPSCSLVSIVVNP
jgi:hypothetical protein